MTFLRTFKITIFLIALAAGGVLLYLYVPQESFNSALGEPTSQVRIGYFDGGRVNMLYRAYINNYFEEEGAPVSLYTKFLNEKEIFQISKTYREVQELKQGRERSGRIPGFGKISGIEIVDKIMAGELDGGTIGESSFIASVARGVPIVAVAQLGYERIPGKAIVMRRDALVESSQDLRGKTLASRRAGPGEEVFLREFLDAEGLTENDLTIIDQVDEDDMSNWFRDGKIDGGLFHIFTVKHMVERGEGYIYRPMDWMNSELSHALLVFRKDYVQNHRDKVQKVVNAYAKRIAYEKALPDEEKDRSWNKALMMEGEFQGLRIAAYDFPPLVKIDLLEEMQDLLFKYNKIDQKVSLSEFITNEFVEKFYYEKFQ